MVAHTVKNLPAGRETGFDPWVRKIPCRREWQPTPVSLPGESHGQRPSGLLSVVLQKVVQDCDLHFHVMNTNIQEAQ